MPKVTALMPLYNGIDFIEESLKSVHAQTFKDWEFIIVNDFGSDDGCADVVQQYAEKDPRIKLVQTEERLGIAACLNLGLDMAQGEYIARVDCDDPSDPKRFETQVKYMDEHSEVSLCSVFQMSVTRNGNSVQVVEHEKEALKAAMLFGCEISHCGVMLRKADFDAHNWRYDPSYLGEDYELWTRMLMEGATIVNIPKVLVSHRWDFGNISIAKGERLVQEVRRISARCFSNFGVDVKLYPSELFSGWRNRPEKYAKENCEFFLKEGYRLIQEIIEKNEVSKYCEPRALEKVLFDRWDWIKKSCGLQIEEKKYGQFSNIKTTPIVSVVLPTFNSSKFISRAIDSVQSQTYTDWELLVVNDFDSDDGTAEIVKMYAWNDSKIRLIQAEKRLGLSESLNLGIREAKGKYIARLDADDTSHPTRFEKQVRFMEKNPKVGICGTWQHHYGNGKDWIHQAATDSKLQKCHTLFWCDLCHSTLMLRRKMFVENNLFYDSKALAEDWELWTRAIQFMEIANIPEVLGEYEEGTGITGSKFQDLVEESGKITARTLKRVLNLNLTVYESSLLNGWIRPITDPKKQSAEFAQLRNILTKIWERNKEVKVFDKKLLLRTLAAKWYWVRNNSDWKKISYERVKKIGDAFKDNYVPSFGERYKGFKEKNPKVSTRIEKICKFPFRPFVKFARYVTKSLFKACLNGIDKSVERWTWDRFKRRENLVNKVSINNTQYIPYYIDSKIRVVFLFQVASFWPAQESVYKTMLNDDRFDVKLVCYDEPYDRTIKTETSREYLEAEHYDFEPWEEFNINEFNPHIVFFQTVYDTNRRNLYKSTNLKQEGCRVIYIPYGIEIADTEHAHTDHFRRTLVQNAWKIYTFSETMKQDYQRYMRYPIDVCALGLPRFDALSKRELFPQLDAVKEKANDRKVVLWKVHFPKVIKENGETIMVTPYITEYINFANKLKDYSDLFFVFMPHPRFKEFNEDASVRRSLMELYSILEEQENVYIDDRDDYRNSLLNADCIIVDRSAVMVEASTVGVPVLYMYNGDYSEPMTRAVQPLVDTYYQGTTCEDMVNFVEQFRRGEDPQKEQREAAFKQCIPYFDGKCGERIKEDIVASLEKEQNQSVEMQLEAMNERLAKLENMLPQFDKSVERWTWERYQRTQKDIDNNRDKLYKLNEIGVNIFQYMTGIELNNKFTKEREIVFNPKNVPADHYKRYEFAVNHIYEDDLVADIACACGYGSSMLSEKAKKVVGVDINPDVINFAKKIYGNEKIDFYCQDAQKLKLDYNFTKAVSFETLEHILHPELFLKALYNLLSDDGQIICSVPNETVAPYAKANNKFHYRQYTKDEFIDLVQSAGFHVKELYYQYWDDGCNISKKMSDKYDARVLVIVATKPNKNNN